ncbi:MAG: hypothetical protein NE330_08005 [Lentisphaeraceae bacterium]|nr:hypothetical protein [Lentisphaeraceae bacterium]
MNDAVEAVLLGYEKPGEDFSENWHLLNDCRTNEEMKLAFKYSSYTYTGFNAFEELRLAILIGNFEIPEYFFGNRRWFIDQLAYEPDKARALYLRGLYFFLKAENLHMKGDKAARDLLIGRTGAAVQLYLSLRHNPDEVRYKKAKKLFDLIRVKSVEWYGQKIKPFPEKSFSNKVK